MPKNLAMFAIFTKCLDTDSHASKDIFRLEAESQESGGIRGGLK